MSNIIHKKLSDQVIGCAILVHRTVGAGFMENIYENSLCIELGLNNIPYERQKLYKVLYKNHTVGNYLADIVVDNKIILELKSVHNINKNMEAAPAHPCARGI